MSLSTANGSGDAGHRMNDLGQRSLCNACDKFDLYSFNRDPFGFRGYKYSDVEKAAASGCTFCSLLEGAFKNKMRGASQSFPSGWERQWWIHLSIQGYSRPRDLESGDAGLQIRALEATIATEDYTLPRRIHGVKVTWATYSKAFASVLLHIAADSDSQAARNNDIVGRYVGEHVLSEDYLRMIYRWVQNCLQHPECCQTMSGARTIDARNAPLPTRCLESLPNGFRIKETGSMTGTYTTLSHRWTSKTVLCRTTVENIDTRKTYGSWIQGLPKMFHDVIELARRLGVGYVWIDCLCIIQDRDRGADWQRESIKMADYYQYSWLTIAGTSVSSDDALVPPKITSPPRIARLPYRDSSGSRHGYFYAYSYNWEVDRQYTAYVKDSELLTRGWVFHEWLLSRRIVYFTPGGTFFECERSAPRNDLGEISQEDSDETAMSSRSSGKYFFNLNTAAINPLWYRTVAAYSSLSLTRPDMDRIVALSGVATEFREALIRKAIEKKKVTAPTVPSGLEYVSGLWLPDLHYGLLWERKVSKCKIERISGYPTWSWTSVPYPVVWDDGEVTSPKPKAELVAIAASEHGIVSVDSLRPIGDSAISPQKVFDVDNQFASLHMRGKVIQVLVRELFNSQSDIELVSATSGHKGKSEKSTWRIVCSSLSPTEIAG